MNRSENEEYMLMLDKAAESKQDFIDYLQYIDGNITEEVFYDEIISWTEERLMLFLQWWNWDLNILDLSVWEYCELAK